MQINYAELITLCEKNGIELLLLFGSRVNHTSRIDSDVDLGILLKDTVPVNRVEIMADLTRVFQELPVDAVILNHADPVLKFEIISNYRLLYCTNDDIFINFYLNTLKQYNDIQKFLKLENFYLENFLGGARDGAHRCDPPQIN